MGKLDGQVALITGGGGGIARGMIAALAKEGADISIAERRAQRGEEAATIAQGHGAQGIALVCDVRHRDQVDVAVAQTVEQLGRVDILINNATGAGPDSANVPFMAHTEAALDRVLDVDVKGTFHFMQACFPHFKEQGRGKIINFSSAAGSERMAGFAAYSAAKEGVRALSGVAAREWGAFGINVNIVCPSALTPELRQYLESQRDQATLDEMQREKPIHRTGDPEHDIGRVVVFLASDDASYMTGHTFWVDGGSSIHA
jgi:NAD(P)-dependent dehydrogenase (short-subunit alcohol dehydrogenase family)